ncbi:MAG: UDP-N-acetylmuramate dehydrogenase [Prochlorotrichaceae cyanobacterium]
MLQNCVEKKVPLKLTAVPNVLHTNMSLAPFTSFRVGGSAEWYAAPRSVEDLIACFEWANLEKLPITMLGAGSNLLISDRGLSGLILSTRHLQGAHYNANTGQVTALAGEPLPRLAWEAARRGLRGLEWAAGIPGTVGGAVVMNAGAQGSCTADFLRQVQVLSPQGCHWLNGADLHYSYRSSLLQKKHALAVQATFQLTPGGDPKEVLALTRQNLSYRKSTQPYHLPSCGSVFRNPNPYKAGWLIEQSGLKGYQIGNAQVSQRHANFIVNLGGATATDIFYLIHYVQDCIRSKWGIDLEPEVKMLGEFPSTVYLAERAAS